MVLNNNWILQNNLVKKLLRRERVEKILSIIVANHRDPEKRTHIENFNTSWS